MFFTECAHLAEQHPDLAKAVEQIDGQLSKFRANAVVRPQDMASFLAIDQNQVNAILGKLAQSGLLCAEDMIECPHCGMAAPRSDYQNQMDEDGEYRCTSCDTPLVQRSIRAITGFRRGAKWKDVPLPPGSPAKKSPQLDDNAWYAYSVLASTFSVNKDALRKRLKAFRGSHLNGWKENTDRRPREPKELYQLKAVKSIIEDLQASSERPAK